MHRVTSIKPAPVVISRTLPAAPSVVFTAWREPAHLERWFAPAGFVVTRVEIDFRPGGAFAIHMRAPDGQELVSQGAFTEIDTPHRLAFTSRNGRFAADTIVSFEADGDGDDTLLTIHQAYEIFARCFIGPVAEAAENWRTTLDKLDAEVARMTGEPVLA